MAALNELIDKIENPELRAQIQEAANKLAKQKKFGLVFEEHLPECTPLYDIPVKKGATVSVKSKSVNDTYKVLKIEVGKAWCMPKSGNTAIEYPVEDLVVTAEFGEAIYPYLKPLDSVCNAPDSDLWHTLIEADNYHALQLLEYLYAGKVDCIYIDPPYNTGARDWKYNNNYVDNSDEYRHSKWLSMMQKRLKIAKKLLNPQGSILVISIDEKEYLHLGCLLEEMFPDGSITMATDIINPRAGVARPGAFTRNQEYVFFVQIGANSNIVPDIIDGEQKQNPIWFSLMRTGSNSSRKDRPNLFYPIWVYPNGKLHSIGNNIPFDMPKESVSAPGENIIGIWPLRPDGRENTWQLGRDTLSVAFSEGTAKINHHSNKYTVNYLRNAEKTRIETGEITVLGKDENGALILEHNNDFGKTKAPSAVWDKASHDAGLYGSTLINSIIPGHKFSFPKSLYAEQDSIRYCVGQKKNALIVDFFAGSGTTLHAVNLINAEDGGNRRCIMVTNNEVSVDEAKNLLDSGYNPGDEEWEKLGIAHYVTWPRTVCSIEGHDINGKPLKGNYIGSDKPMSEGFKTNAVFFKLGFLDKTKVSLGMQFKELLSTLWMKAGAIGECPTIDGTIPDVLILPKNKMAILNNENMFAEFKNQLDNHPEIEVVYLVTDYEAGFVSMTKALDGKKTYQLYRDYLDNFRINAGRNSR